MTQNKFENKFENKLETAIEEMSDDYLCFEVFVRGQNAIEYKHSSRLHAVDAHHALMLARDCYTRRNEAKSLWVIPSDALHELDLDSDSESQSSQSSDPLQLFEVFAQLKSGLDYRHMSSIWANSESHAFKKADALLGDSLVNIPKGGIWICNARDVNALQHDEKQHFFDPMHDKLYRLPTFYILPDAVNHM